jgi:hypothetical protein
MFLDGYSRSIIHWDLRESMTEAEIEGYPEIPKTADTNPIGLSGLVLVQGLEILMLHVCKDRLDHKFIRFLEADEICGPLKEQSWRRSNAWCSRLGNARFGDNPPAPYARPS